MQFLKFLRSQQKGKLPSCQIAQPRPNLNAPTTYNYPNVTDSQWFYSIILLNHYIANLIILC